MESSISRYSSNSAWRRSLGVVFAWPPRWYSCSFCRREFRSAQALGGHMNVHRRDRARLLKHHHLQTNNHQPAPPNHDLKHQEAPAAVTNKALSAVGSDEEETNGYNINLKSCKRRHHKPAYSSSSLIDTKCPPDALLSEQGLLITRRTMMEEHIDLELRLGHYPPTTAVN